MYNNSSQNIIIVKFNTLHVNIIIKFQPKKHIQGLYIKYRRITFQKIYLFEILQSCLKILKYRRISLYPLRHNFASSFFTTQRVPGRILDNF